MTTATDVRRPARTAPPGTGHLHQALEHARDLSALRAFCRSHNCPPEAVSDDGVRLDILRIFDLMRSRGYSVSALKRTQHQPRKGFTAWCVHVQLPGAVFDLAFFTPNAP